MCAGVSFATRTLQDNTDVDVAAPGEGILSSVPLSMGFVRAWVGLPSTNASIQSYMGNMGSSNEPRAVRDTPLGSATGQVVQCPGKMPVPGGSSSSTAAQSSTSSRWRGGRGGGVEKVRPACEAARGGKICLAAIEDDEIPDEGACNAYVACIKGGGSALMVWRPSDKDFDPNTINTLRLNCGTRCKCWSELQQLLADKRTSRNSSTVKAPSPRQSPLPSPSVPRQTQQPSKGGGGSSNNSSRNSSSSSKPSVSKTANTTTTGQSGSQSISIKAGGGSSSTAGLTNSKNNGSAVPIIRKEDPSQKRGLKANSSSSAKPSSADSTSKAAAGNAFSSSRAIPAVALSPLMADAVAGLMRGGDGVMQVCCIADN